MMIALRAFARCGRGSAGAEMALMLPLLVLLLFSGFEAGNFFYSEHKIAKGLRDGARFASRQSFANVTCTTIDSTAVTRIKNVTRTGQITGGRPHVFGWSDADITVTPSCSTSSLITNCASSNCGIYTGAANAPQITITAHVRYPSFFGALGLIHNDYYLNGRQQTAVMGL